MTTRRTFLKVAAGGLTAVGAAPMLRAAQRAPFGLQLYSVRRELDKDVPGTLAKVKAIGFTDVETAGFHGLTAPAFAGELKKAGLVCRSGHFEYDRFRDDPAGVVRDGQTLGAKFVACAWIPHQGKFTRQDCLRAAVDFNRWGKAAKAAGMKFFYHAHGYEFAASPDGTLFDTLMKETDPALVFVQADIFWLTHGGANPVALFDKYPRRWVSTHLKDMAKGTPTGLTTGSADVESNVPLGTGTIDWPSVLRAANKAGVEKHYIEDESSSVLAQIPKTLDYLRSLRLS